MECKCESVWFLFRFYLNQKKTLEINPRHPLIKELQSKVELNPKSDAAIDLAHILLDTAKLRGGYYVDDSNEFATRIERMLRASIGVDVDAPVSVGRNSGTIWFSLFLQIEDEVFTEDAEEDESEQEEEVPDEEADDDKKEEEETEVNFWFVRLLNVISLMIVWGKTKRWALEINYFGSYCNRDVTLFFSFFFLSFSCFSTYYELVQIEFI